MSSSTVSLRMCRTHFFRLACRLLTLTLFSLPLSNALRFRHHWMNCTTVAAQYSDSTPPDSWLTSFTNIVPQTSSPFVDSGTTSRSATTSGEYSTLLSSGTTNEPSQPTCTVVVSDGGRKYMDIVSEWRAKLGLCPLAYSMDLEQHAVQTVTDSKGAMVHELLGDSHAQVLAPGDPDDFENVFVGGWLCEQPELPGLDGVCYTMSKGWDYQGQTDHAAILISPSYSNIGCGCVDSIWACDLN